MTDYYRFDGYPMEVWGEEDFVARDKFLVAWADRYTLISEIVGTVYPYLPATNAIPHGATITPYSVIDGSSSYEQAVVEILYSNKRREYDSNFVSEEFIATKWVESLSADDFKWDDDETLTGGWSPSIVIPMIDIRTTFYGIWSVPSAAVTMMGYCNSGTATSFTTGMSFSAGTLMYDSFYLKRDVGLGQEDGFKLRYVFRARAVDWNYFFRASNEGEWRTLKCASDDSDYVSYPYGNLSNLVP